MTSTQFLIFPLSDSITTTSIMGDNSQSEPAKNKTKDGNTMNLQQATSLPFEDAPIVLGASSDKQQEDSAASSAAVNASILTPQEGPPSDEPPTALLNLPEGETTKPAARTDTAAASLFPNTFVGGGGATAGLPVETGASSSGTPFFASAASAGAAVSTSSSNTVGRETGIVSHLRRSSSLGSSSRQDIETALKGRRGSLDGSLNSASNSQQQQLQQQQFIGIHPMLMSPAGFGAFMGGANGSNVANNPMAAASAAGNPFAAALFLQNHMNQMAAMNANAVNNNGMLMPHPNSNSNHPMIMSAAGFGMGTNFGNLTSGLASAGKPGSVLDPRFAGGGGAFFGHLGAAAMGPPRRKPLTLYMDCDTESLSEYQCLIRQQIELFEADKSEAASSVQGRNKQIVEGQVGIRCRHCAAVPPRQRQKGSMYFPTKLDRIYQAAQNLSTFHLCDNCKHVPENVRKRILLLRERKSPAGGGKRYWGEGVRCLDVVEDSNGLRFR